MIIFFYYIFDCADVTSMRTYQIQHMIGIVFFSPLTRVPLNRKWHNGKNERDFGPEFTCI